MSTMKMEMVRMRMYDRKDGGPSANLRESLLDFGPRPYGWTVRHAVVHVAPTHGG